MPGQYVIKGLSPASISGDNLIGLKPAIPYEIRHSPLAQIEKTFCHDI